MENQSRPESKNNDETSDEIETKEQEKLPFPKSVFFIISTEFCERFSYYGMKTVLVLFLNQVLLFNEDDCTILYHAFNALCYFTPIMGAVMADSFFGKFRTIFYISILYAVGQVILSIGAVGDSDEGIPGLPAVAMSFIGLFLIAVGTGGIKPCVATFGGEQFKLPEQESSIKLYFSMFYAAINAGGFISSIITPMLRQNQTCFGKDTCYPLAFGVPACLMVMAVVFFLLGRVFNLYVMKVPDENILVKTVACIWNGFQEKRKRHQKEQLPSMLDYSKEKYGKGFVSDVKALKAVTIMFLPFPIFWALFDQQGSRWTFQATRMNGDIFGFQILPDQMQVINPILILVFIPLFDYVVYPIFAKFNMLKTPLQRMGTGGVLAAVSFFVSGGLEMVLETTYPQLPQSGDVILHAYNGINITGCKWDKITIHYNDTDGQIATELDLNDNPFAKSPNLKEGTFFIPEFQVKCPNINDISFHEAKFYVSKQKPKEDQNAHIDGVQSLLFTLINSQGHISVGNYPSRLEKSETGLPYVKVLWNVANNLGPLTLFIFPTNQDYQGDDSVSIGLSNYGDNFPKKIKTIGDQVLELRDEHGELVMKKTFKAEIGANYEMLVQIEENESLLKDFYINEVTEPNSVHMLLLLIQLAIMTAGEIMLSVTSLHFSFSQAPATMKAVILSIRYLTNAVGNVIDVVVIAALKGVFSSQSYEFFLFGSIMMLDMIVFIAMSRRYKYVDYTSGEGVQKDEEDEAVTKL